MPLPRPSASSCPLRQLKRAGRRICSAVLPVRSIPMDETDNERASSRLAAQTFMPIMVEAFHDGLREAGSLSRWLLATLVLINGAAAIAMLPLEMAAGAKLAGAGAFVLGILAALGAGTWSLYAFRRVSISAGTMLAYWMEVANEGQRLEALEQTM